MRQVEVLLVSAQSATEYLEETKGRRSASDLGVRYVAAQLNSIGIAADIVPAHLNTEQELAARLMRSPELLLLGFSVNVRGLPGARNRIKLAAQLRPDVPVVIGGFLPTFASERILEEWSEVQFVICGEGEQPAVALARAVKAGDSGFESIPSLSSRSIPFGCVSNNPAAPQNTDLDAIPLPWRTLRDMPMRTQDLSISASRGCYSRCAFCSIPAFNSGSWRGRSPEHVASEIAKVRKDFGTEFVNFVDDSFFGRIGQTERAQQFLDAFRYEQIRVPFRISLRANDVDRDRIAMLKEVGLTAVQLGAESFSERQLVHEFRKGLRPDVNSAAIRLLEEMNIHVQVGLILFEPSTELHDLSVNAHALLDTSTATFNAITSELHCAEGTGSARALVRRGESQGVTDFINHQWRFQHEQSRRVFDILKILEIQHAVLGTQLLEAITPPCNLADSDLGLMKDLYDRYKRWSLRLLLHVIDQVRVCQDDRLILAQTEMHFRPELEGISGAYWSAHAGRRLEHL